MKLVKVLSFSLLGMLLFSASQLYSQRKPIRTAVKRTAAVPTPKPTPTVQFAALAMDETLVAYTGWASEQYTAESAQEIAMKDCERKGGKGCKIVLAWSGGVCGVYRAVRKGEGSGAGWGFAKSPAEADIIAWENVRKANKGLQAPTNNAEACNKITGPDYKLLYAYTPPEQPSKKQTECLVEYEVDIESGNDASKGGDWLGRYFSPIYHLPASSCPATLSYDFYAYQYMPKEVWSGPFSYVGFVVEGKTYNDFDSYMKAVELFDPSGLGRKYSEGFYNWIATKSSPSGTTFENFGQVHVMEVTQSNIEKMVDDIRDVDTHRRNGQVLPMRPICLDHKPEGVTPIKVYGAELCQGWVR